MNRHSMRLYGDRHVDVWLLCWTNQQETGMHDHDVSSGAVQVVEGNLVEDRLQLGDDGLRETSTPVPGGSAFDFGQSRIHRVRHPEGESPAISIHAYSPPLNRMGYYDADPFGAFRRTSVSYTKELTPAPVSELRPRREDVAAKRDASRNALEQIVRALGYPAEWAEELERREFESGRLWRSAGEMS
jgi:hypothetical protein